MFRYGVIQAKHCFVVHLQKRLSRLVGDVHALAEMGTAKYVKYNIFVWQEWKRSI